MTSLERILGKALMGVMISIDLSDDDEIDPDVAGKIVEPVVAYLRSVGEEDRNALANLFAECAQDERDPDRREAAIEFPGSLDL